MDLHRFGRAAVKRKKRAPRTRSVWHPAVLLWRLWAERLHVPILVVAKKKKVSASKGSRIQALGVESVQI